MVAENVREIGTARGRGRGRGQRNAATRKRRPSRKGTIQLSPAFQDWAKARGMDDAIAGIISQVRRFKSERRLGTDPEVLKRKLAKAKADAAALEAALKT